jgi:hypothetical protein
MTTPALRTSARSCPARTRRPGAAKREQACGATQASARASGCDASAAGACSAAVTAAALALSSAACAAASSCGAAAFKHVACCVPMRCATHRSRAVYDGRGGALGRLQRRTVRGGRERLCRGRGCKRFRKRLWHEAAAPRDVRRQLRRAEGDEQWRARRVRVRAARAQRQHSTKHRGGRQRRRRRRHWCRRTLRKQLPTLLQCMRHDARSGRCRGAQLAAQQQRREHGRASTKQSHPGGAAAERAACASRRMAAAVVPGKRSGGGLTTPRAAREYRSRAVVRLRSGMQAKGTSSPSRQRPQSLAQLR